MSGPHAAVDRQANTGNEPGGVRTEEDSSVLDIRDLAETAERRLPDDAGDGGFDIRREAETRGRYLCASFTPISLAMRPG